MDGGIVADYATYCIQIGHGKGTVEQRRGYARRLCRAMDPLTCTSGDILAYMADRKWSPETRRSARMAYRSFFGWLTESGRRVDDPMAKVPAVRIPLPCAHPTPDRVLAAARLRANSEERLMLDLAALAGLRRAEIAGLHSRNLEGDILRVKGKGGRTRIIPVSDELAARIEERGPGWLFPGRFEGTHTGPDRVGRTLSRLLGPGYTGHGLRHRFATQAFEATGDILAVQQLLGHASVATTQRYIKLTMARLRRAALAAAS